MTFESNIERAAAEFGYREEHRAAIAALVPDGDSLEANVVFAAQQIAGYATSDDTDLMPAIRWWAALAERGLRRRHPQADAEQITLAARGVVLLALALDPKTLPPAIVATLAPEGGRVH
jgi:hypothetical protein